MKKRWLGLFLSLSLSMGALTGCGILPSAEEFDQKEEVRLEFTSRPEGEQEEAGGEEAKEKENAEESENQGDSQEASVPAKEPTVLEQAERMAAQYDYDGAIQLLKSQPEYDSDSNMQKAADSYEETKASCVEYPLEEITHVFYHTLIRDTSKAFDGDSREAGYNQVMTTIEEFNKITQSMYEKGYVMVSVHDMATVNEDGTMSRGSILLPPGKIPFVLSQDDVSYYHYMDGDGMATRLILDENGEVKNEYVEDDGSISVGNYDMVPLIDAFVREHPDFSYRGRKGILAMTGYNGVLGYRTDIAYKTRENLDQNQKEWLDAHPDFDYDKEVAQATKVADAMKAEGWEFASHTWGHLNAETDSAEKLQTDNEKWEANVAPVLGKTDVIIFAFGADIGDWKGYSEENPKFAYFKSRGYRYYCNVDSSQYWVQLSDEYFRQGRRNLDGYRMYYNPEMLADLFDVDAVWDSSRPTPVPPM